jgi:glycerol-3-phosphate cytidylyltransferase-like family protein
LLEQLLDTKDLIEKRKREGHTVALVHLSWDLMHSSHIQYMNTIRAKLQQRLKLDDKNIKLIVWVEADSRTMQRKKKENVNKEGERVYSFWNIKAVDHAFVEFEGVMWEMENEERPAWIVKYLDPSILVWHQEHLNSFTDYLWICRRLKANNSDSKCLVINYWDTQKYLLEDEVRSKYNRSTTNTIKQIFDLYRNNAKYNKNVLNQ